MQNYQMVTNFIKKGDSFQHLSAKDGSFVATKVPLQQPDETKRAEVQRAVKTYIHSHQLD